MSIEKLSVGPVFGPYTYNYDYVRPLAYADGLHLQDLPTLDWFKLVGEQLLKIFANELAEKAEDFLEDKIKDLFNRLLHHERREKRDLAEVKAEVNDLLGFLDEKKEGKNSFESVEGALEWADRLIKALTPEAESTDKRSLKDYKDLFTTFPIPEISKELTNDAFFANLRVAGYNPLMLARMSSVPSNLGITEEKFRQAPGFENDSLHTAMSEGRLYLADYKELSLLEPGQNPAPKNVYKPIALFGVPAGGKDLAPIAIQVSQDADSGNLFGPRDGQGWEKAKTCVQSSDGTYHELVSHLGRTHLLVEPFVVATHRRLDEDHPIHKLLMLHFEGTIFINGLAVDFLVNPGGSVDQLLQGTIESDLKLTAEGLLAVPFNESWLPTWMKDRGLDDDTMLPDYPYRDDGMLVWQAIGEWCKGYVNAVYKSDEDMRNDDQLMAWAAEVAADDGGRVKDFGEQGELRTREYLAGALTMIIFTGSAAHAAVNFPQLGIMSYTPGVPLAGYKPPPNGEEPNAYDWIDMLPDINMAKLQFVVLFLLGGVYYTRLGRYAEDQFTDPQIKQQMAVFQENLKQVATTIEQRNEKRTYPYTYLLPNNIPQSINI
jgi:arachidonate 15-lipoxygenase